MEGEEGVGVPTGAAYSSTDSFNIDALVACKFLSACHMPALCFFLACGCAVCAESDIAHDRLGAPDAMIVHLMVGRVTHVMAKYHMLRVPLSNFRCASNCKGVSWQVA